MPQIGEIKRYCDRGLSGRGKSIWLACVDCGKGRWVSFRKGHAESLRCRSCQCKRRVGKWREKNANWKGGRYKLQSGYIRLRIYPDDFFFAMSNSQRKGIHGTILEHRLVMAQHLGRCLHSWEIVHHKNGVKDDNRIENLQVILSDGHNQITLMEQRIKLLESRVLNLEAENILLRGESWEKSNGLYG